MLWSGNIHSLYVQKKNNESWRVMGGVQICGRNNLVSRLRTYRGKLLF